MYKISINGEYLELSPNLKIQSNRLLLDISDLSKRGVNISNVLNVPRSNKNNSLLGNPDRLSSNNKAFESSYNTILEDDNSIIMNGDAVVKSYSEKKGSKIQISEGLDFWGQIEKLQLHDLQLEMFDFEFSLANMNALKSKGSNVFITALADFSGVTTPIESQKYDYTRPFFYVRVLIDKIAESVGYTVDYNGVLSSTKIDNIGIASNTQDFFVSDLKYQFQNANINGVLDFTEGVELFNNNGTSINVQNIVSTDTYKTAFVLKGSVSAPVDTRIRMVFNDRTEVIPVPKGDSFLNFRTDLSEPSATLTIESDGLVFLEDVYFYSMISESEIFTVEEDIDIQGLLALASYNTPLMTCKKLLKIVMNMFFLDIDIDSNKKIISFFDIGRSVNSNNVVDLSKRVNAYNQYSSGNMYGKINTMGYSNDDDLDNSLGRVFFNVENENAKDTKSIIEIDSFSASNEVTLFNERVVEIPVYNVSESSRISVSDRIVFFNEVGSFGINATFSEVSFQRNFNDHYRDFVEYTKRERVFNLSVYLNKMLYNRISKARIVYVDFLQSNFLVLKISGFEDGTPCTLKVVKYG